MLAQAVARHLYARGLAVFDETGAAGDCFLGTLPATPDRAVAVRGTPGPPSDPGLPYDTPGLQVFTRDSDQAAAEARAWALYGELHGLADVLLPGGVKVVQCTATASGPSPLGQDDARRWQFALNFTAEVRNPTTHRAAL